MKEISIQDLHSNTAQKIRNVREELEKYLVSSNLRSLVLGLSGGIDSALVAALCFPVTQKLGVRLLGYTLPIESNRSDETTRGMVTGMCFTDEYKIVSLESVYHAFKTDPAFMPTSSTDMQDIKFDLGNIKARLRMQYLYCMARRNRGCVLSTDNYSEYMLGFFTIFGDQGDISPIQMYYKTEVYEMARNILATENLNPMAKLVLEQTINATPTDGLGITNSDLDQIGAPSYDIVDMILLGGENCDLSKEYPKVWERVNRTGFKRNHPYNFPRI